MKNRNVSTGLSFGVIIGLIYIILLYWRWNSAENMIMFGIIAIISFMIILGILFYEAFYRRKENGGFIELKDLFQTLFISVLIFELFYAIFNFMYLKYIDPEVIDRMKIAMQDLMDKAGDKVTEADKAKQIEQFDKFEEATKPLKVLQQFLIGLAISGVFALLISLIMKKKKKIEFEN